MNETRPPADVGDPGHRRLFDAIVSRILGVCHPERIVVFGSFARGSPGPDSDVDVLVIDAGAGRRRDRSLQCRLALRDLGVPVDVIVATPQDVARYGNAVGLIYRPALAEGVVVYDRSAA